MSQPEITDNRQTRQPSPRRRLTGALLNLFLLLGSLLVVLIVCEIGLRFFYPAGGQPRINEFDALLGHRLQSNLDLVHVWSAHENVSTIRTNGHGFRGPELPGGKNPGELRILLLGDSYTFGFGVGEEDTFARLLQDMLNNESGTPDQISLINAGVSSYGTAQEMLLYESMNSVFESDLVILNLFVGNDIQENLCLAVPRLRPHNRFPCFSVENGQLSGPVLPVAPPPDQPQNATRRKKSILGWLKSSHLYELAFQRAVGIATTNPGIVSLFHWLGWQVGPDYLPHVVAGWYQPQISDRGWSLTRLLIRRLHEQVRRDGAQLMVVIIPSRIQVIPELLELSRLFYPGEEAVEAFIEDQSKPQRQLSSFLDAEGIPNLDLLPVLREDGRSGALYYPTIAHWNEAGHLVAATEMLRFIQRQLPLAVPGQSSTPSGQGDARGTGAAMDRESDERGGGL